MNKLKPQHPQDLEGQLNFGPVLQDETSQGALDAVEKEILEHSIEELSCYCRLESKAMTSKLIVAVDPSKLPVRMMIASVRLDYCQGEVTVCPQQTAEFTSLEEFASDWDRRKSCAVRVAMPAEEADPLGIRAWLERSGCPVERYEWWSYRAHLRHDLTLENTGIGREFRRAYVLAVYSGYRLQAATISRSIWARLLEAHHLLDDVRRDAHRLSAALDDRPPDWNEIPF